MAVNPQPGALLGRRGRLELDEVLASLVVDGYLTGEDAKRVRMSSRSGKSAIELHPLVLVANSKLENRREAGRPLSLETLMEWLAGKADLPYLKIDPMKVNVAQVTQVVSSAYAQRHRILPVAASSLEVTFATAEPFDMAWANDLAQMLRRDVRRVVSNPIDINRYLLEFYGVQRSIQLAQDQGGAASPPRSSTSNSWWSSARPAKWARTIAMSCTSSTGCCNTRSNNAHRTSTSSRVATPGRCASVSTA